MISDDEDDDDAEFQRQLRLAMEASKAEGASRALSYVSSRSTSPQPQPPAQDSGPKPAFLSERAQMEKERLERQKRMRPDDSGEMGAESSKRQRTTDTRAKASTTYKKVSTASMPTIEQVFWEGELRQVANRHAEPRKDGQLTFRLTEVLGKV